ncbi:STAS domain-containing protein [Actinoplanes sp. NPDC051346]|uniref:ATP-binding protein n=1 Tax=Actinoplanes sp. NPDC051346 TaxID=3155048 RepID=UPI00342CE31F
MSIETLVRAEVGRLLVTIVGHLELADAAKVRNRLMKCLAEQPEALLLDVSALDVREPLALAVFSTIARQAERWPGIPVLLCAPRPSARQALRLAAFRRLLVFASLEAARAKLDDDRRVRPSLSDELLPVCGAARQARDLATDACLRWNLPHLIAPASLIASELVSNVVDHAHTMMTLRLTLRHRYLYLSLRDGSPEPPRPAPTNPASAGGRGLMLVKACAASWDWLPCEGGKIVWAALRTA